MMTHLTVILPGIGLDIWADIGQYGSIFLVRNADRQAPLMMTHVTVILPGIGSEISTDITDTVIGLLEYRIGRFLEKSSEIFDTIPNPK